MKKSQWISLLALAGFAAGAQALPSALTFDGFCDGLTGITANGQGVISAVWNLDACDGAPPSTAAAGLAGRWQGINGATGTYDVVTQAAGVAAFVVRINNNGTWAYFLTDGTLFNSGTWTEGAPAAAAASSRFSARP